AARAGRRLLPRAAGLGRGGGPDPRPGRGARTGAAAGAAPAGRGRRPGEGPPAAHASGFPPTAGRLPGPARQGRPGPCRASRGGPAEAAHLPRSLPGRPGPLWPGQVPGRRGRMRGGVAREAALLLAAVFARTLPLPGRALGPGQDRAERLSEPPAGLVVAATG